MSDKLPPLPQSFTILSRLQSGTEEVVELAAVRAYGQQCYDKALEDAALEFDALGEDSSAALIRAMKGKP